MFFAETTNGGFTSKHIKRSRSTNCACVVWHQRIQWAHNADSTNAAS